MVNARKSPPRQRLIEALDAFDDTHSVVDVGIDALLKQAGVAKASLYQHFGSKDALVVAWLDDRQTRWFGYFEDHVRRHATPEDPRSELDAAFGFLSAWFAREDFAGCPFITTRLQVKNPQHPAAVRSRAYADRLHAFFHRRLRSMGAKAPRRTAAALLELFLGAVVVRQMAVGSNAATAARTAANQLLDAAVS